MPVIALAGHVQIEPEAVHMQVLGLRQRETPVGGVRGVIDVIGLAAAVARGDPFDLEGEDTGDRRAAGQPRHRELDRLVVDAAHDAGIAAPFAELADQLYLETLEAGFGADDMAAVVRALEARTASRGSAAVPGVR